MYEHYKNNHIKTNANCIYAENEQYNEIYMGKKVLLLILQKRSKFKVITFSLLLQVVCNCNIRHIKSEH